MDRQMDGGDRITSCANVVGKHDGCSIVWIYLQLTVACDVDAKCKQSTDWQPCVHYCTEWS